MNAPAPYHEWSDANQRLLVAEFGRVKARLAGEDEQAAAATAKHCRAAMPEPAAIDRLTERFSLSTFERDILLLCAGAEMDSELGELCAAARNGAARPQPSFGLALAILADPHWSALSPADPLRRWRLVEVGDEAGLTEARLRLDERVLHYLAGINYLDVRLRPLLRALQPAAFMTDVHRGIVGAVLDGLRQRPTAIPAVHLQGSDRDGQSDIAAAVAAGLGLQLHLLRAEDIPGDVHEREALSVLWQRESTLLDSALLIDCTNTTDTGTAVRLAEDLKGIIFVSSREPVEWAGACLRFGVDTPDAQEQRGLWRQALGPAAGKLNGSLDEVAAQYALSTRTIIDTGAAIAAAVSTSDTPDDVLRHACRSLGRRRLDELAQRIESAARWDDLILPDQKKAILRQIATHVRNRLKVCEDWGFAGKSRRGLGLSTLFAGESGTGKTMAAEALADELCLDLYRIDLSSVVSKYIGETEKNLRKVFDAAESSGAILLFDEADALFGKRSEVKDSHDRYANIEVSYLLQRMEAYTGLAILTTNQKTAMDSAFHRRLRFVVQFAFPDAAQRESIWRGIFPDATPTDGLDYSKLAQLQVAGGNIRNIALNAAFLAADAGEPVGMKHLLHAARTEGAKRERPLNEAEIRGWI